MLVPISFCDDPKKEVEMGGSFAGREEMITAFKILLSNLREDMTWEVQECVRRQYHMYRRENGVCKRPAVI